MQKKMRDDYIIYRKIMWLEYSNIDTWQGLTTRAFDKQKKNRSILSCITIIRNVKWENVLGPSNEYKYVKPMPLAVTNLKTMGQNLNNMYHGLQYSKCRWLYYLSPITKWFKNGFYRYMVNSTSFVDTQTSALNIIIGFMHIKMWMERSSCTFNN